MIEHFEDEKSKKEGAVRVTNDDADKASKAARYLEVIIERMNSLCPRSSYTLTLHQYNNVKCKCKYVGGLLSGASSIISESIAVTSQGDIAPNTVANEKVEGISLLPT